MESFGIWPAAEVYRLTKSQRKQLVVERSRRAQLTEAIDGILNPAKQESDHEIPFPVA